MNLKTILIVVGCLVLVVIAGTSLFSGKSESPTETPETAAVDTSNVGTEGAVPAPPVLTHGTPAPVGAVAPTDDPNRLVFERALNSLRDGNVEAGIELLNEILKTDPTNGPVLTELGSIYMEKDPAKAAQFFEKALKANPNNSIAVTDLVEVYEMQGKGAKAQTMLTELAKNNPDSPLANRELGQYYMRKGNAQQGLSYIEKAAALAGTGAALSDLASNYARAGNSQKAVDTYQKAIDKVQGEMNQRKGDGARTRHEERTLALTRLDLARLQIERGEFEAAEKTIDQAQGVLSGDRSVKALREEIQRRQNAG